MVFGLFRGVVTDCRRRSFNVSRLIQELQLLPNEAAITSFGDVCTLVRSDLHRGTQHAMNKFCDEWLNLSNNETLIWVIQAAESYGDQAFASFVATKVLGVLKTDGDELHTENKREFLQCLRKRENQCAVIETLRQRIEEIPALNNLLPIPNPAEEVAQTAAALPQVAFTDDPLSRATSADYGDRTTVMQEAADYRAYFDRMELIGSGSYGKAYKTINRTTGREVVLKQIELIASTASQNEATRFFRETTMHSIAKQHRNVVEMLGFKQFTFSVGDVLIVIEMEWCKGGNLTGVYEHQRRKGDPFPIQWVKSWISQIVSALQFLAEQNIVHRDLHPLNVLFRDARYDETSVVKISDFGLARQLKFGDGAVLSTTGDGKVGCLHYRSPETKRGTSSGADNPKRDVWAAGLILLQLVTLELHNKIPFIDKNDEEMNDFIHRCNLADINLKNLLLGMLKPDLNQRLSAAEVQGHDWLRN